MAEHVESENTAENGVNDPEKKLKTTAFAHFNLIIKGQEACRRKGGLGLMKYLAESQDTENGKGELKYALVRIIRGLGSPKIAARAGFFATLVAILSSTKTITVDQIFELIKKHLQTGKSNSKSENADICAGQILVYGALIRSKLFFDATSEEQQKILENLIAAGKKKVYLTLPSYAFILTLIEDIDTKQFKEKVLPVLKPELTKPLEQHSLDTMYVLINVQKKFPAVVNDKFLKKTIGYSNILNEETVKSLCNLLLNTPTMALKHPVCDILAKEIATSNYLETFVSQLDDLLAKPIYNKHIIAVSTLKNILESLEDFTHVPKLLRKNFLQHTITYFKNNSKIQKELQQKIYGFFEAIVNVLKKDKVTANTQVSVLKKLLFYPGVLTFEKITRSKVIQQITSTLNAEGVKKLAKIYAGVVLGEEKQGDENSTETWLNTDRLYAAQMLSKLLGHPAVQPEINWKIDQLKFFIDISIIRSNQYQNIGYELSASLKTTFFKGLDQKLPKLEDLRHILFKLVNHLDSLLTEENFQANLRNPFSIEAFQTFQQTVQMVNKLDNKLKTKSKNQNVIKVFHTLFLHLGLQLFGDVKLADESIKELFSCYERVTNEKNNAQEEDSEDPLWIEVVVDLFLNLLSHNSHLLRSLIRCVFPHLCAHMNATAVHQILSVLDPKNETNPLSKKGEHEDDDASDKEGDEYKENIEEGDDNESDSASDEDMEDEEFEENETTNDKLRQAVRQALGGNGYQTDEESIDIDNLSDSEAERLDTALGQAFKQFKPNLGKKTKQSKDEETLTHFRVRVLDLIEIYLDSNPSMLLSLEIMLPLLQSLEFTVREKYQQPLQDRVNNCLKKLSNLKKFSSIEDVDNTVLSDLLTSILGKGTRNQNITQDMGEAISNCCLFVLRCSQYLCAAEDFPKKSKKKLNSALIEIFGESLEGFFRRREGLVPYVLLKEIFQMNWYGSIELSPRLCNIIFDSEIRVFKRCQAQILLKTLFSNNRLSSSTNENEKLLNILSETAKSFAEKTIELLEALNNGNEETKLSEKFISNLLLTLTSLKKSALKDKESIFNWKQLAELVRTYRSKTKFSKDATTAYKTFCKSIGVPVAVKMQLNNKNEKDSTGNKKEDSEEDEAPANEVKSKEKKVKRKTKNNDNRKLKKEARLARMKMSSEGLSSSFSFVNSNLTKLKDDTYMEVEDTSEDVPLNSKKIMKQKRKVSETNKDIQNVTQESIEEKVAPKKKKKKVQKT